MDTQVIGPVRTMMATIASATEIEKGDLVAQTTGLIVKGLLDSPKLARAMKASAVGDTEIEITKGRQRLRMDASDVFAVAQKGLPYDLAINGGTGKQTINQSLSTYDVLLMAPDENAGTVDSASDVEVIINKPIDEEA